jgi:hypothetical protein
MQEEIIKNLNDPKNLEKMYRESKSQFRKAFDLVYPEIQSNPVAQSWNERLNYSQREISWGTKKELFIVIALSVVAGCIAKIPDLFGLEGDYYYPRNLSFIVFPMLTAYFAWRQSVHLKKALIIGGVTVLSAIYINLLPQNDSSDTLILACIHLPLFLWTVLGFTYTGDEFKSPQKRIDFLKYNGDLIVITTVMLIAGGILSAITIGLFELINLRIEDFYFRHIAIWGLAAAPLIGTYLVQQNPQLVKNISPVIARVFTPLVLTMLVVYIIAIIFTGKDPYNDREFLMIFNLLLIGVMAIILFSISETTKNDGSKIGNLLLLILSIVTIVVNGIALSAILFRIMEWGITPNRMAVLGSNFLILLNLFLVTYRLFKTLKYGHEAELVEKSIANFLPVYSLWTILVTFIFPLLFGFR